MTILIDKLKEFYNYSPDQIVSLLKEFFAIDFFKKYPYLKNRASIVLSGSVSFGQYDKYSDLDIGIIFHSEKLFKKYKMDILLNYKNKYLTLINLPVMIHGMNITYFKLIDKTLSAWTEDWRLNEYSRALVISDPQNNFKNLQKKYQWYPRKIYKEKVKYLFREATFQLFDRYANATKRGSQFYGQLAKMKILRFLMNAILLANRQYTVGDKHLEYAIKNFKNGEYYGRFKNDFVYRIRMYDSRHIWF